LNFFLLGKELTIGSSSLCSDGWTGHGR
jgi:hypothetical protein